ncbi:MAG: oxidoreductase [Alphaproteobacteria bacterium]|nr:MAG: oxidoreductase [Alphaproteobacteria bacterium]
METVTAADADQPFARLFSPYRSGRLDLASRLVMLPHGNGMVRDGVPTGEDTAYFAARARGVGMVITGGTIACAQSRMRVRNLVEAFNPEAVPALRRRTDAVHALGARIVGQLCHLGRETIGGDSEFAPAGASAMRGPRDPWPPHVLDEAEIRDIIAGFAAASLNLREAGYDGMEVHAAHGYLFAQFLSPASNTRNDGWGGSPRKRLCLLAETVAAVRAACGGDFIIGVRLSADEETPDGLGIRDTAAIARALAAQGETDYLSITVGMRNAYVKDATAPVAPTARAAGIIRRESGLPVIVGQKVASPQVAESLLADGVADLVGMARAFVADAEFAAKARGGRQARIRPCVGLNQDCRAFSPHLHCSLNPETGRETRALFDHLVQAVPRRRVAVIGGGPAGMEAARVAALRGHAVTVFEASEALGGQFLLAASLPGRTGLIDFIDHLAGEMRLAGVDLRLGRRIDDLAELDGDYETVIVATGATPAPLVEQTGGPAALSWWNVIHDGAPAPRGSGRAVLADDGVGFWFSYGAAEMLAVAGWQVTFVTSSAAIGANLPVESVGPLVARLGAAGTDFHVLSSVEPAAPASVNVVSLVSHAQHELPCDLIVHQTGRLAAPLPARGALAAGRVHLVGDCVTPRRISHALLDAQRVARAI